MSHRRIVLLGLLAGVLIIAIALPPRARAQAAPAEATERVTVDIELEDCAKTLRRVALHKADAVVTTFHQCYREVVGLEAHADTKAYNYIHLLAQSIGLQYADEYKAWKKAGPKAAELIGEQRLEKVGIQFFERAMLPELVKRPLGIAHQRMFRTDCRIIQPRRNGMCLRDLTIFILEDIREGTVQDSGSTSREARRVIAESRSAAPCFDADHLYLRISDEVVEQADRIAAAADAGD